MSLSHHIAHALPNFKVYLKDYIKRKINKCIIVKYLIMVTAFMSFTLTFELMSWYGNVIIIIILLLIY